MRQIIHKTFTAVSLFLLSTTASAHDMEPVGVYDLGLEIDRAKGAVLVMSIHPSGIRVSSETEMTLTPVLRSTDGNAEFRFPSVIIAGHNRLMRYRRGQATIDEGCKILSSTTPVTNYYERVDTLLPWMERCYLEMDVDFRGCCGKKGSDTLMPVAEINLQPEPLKAPEGFTLSSSVKGEPKIINLEGSAFIDFRVNRTEIDPTYRNNVSELSKILNTIDIAHENPDATITGIFIKGFASPEGAWDNNVRLAKGRTSSLKDYIKQKYGFDENRFHTSFEAEDWQGLRQYVDTCSLASRTGLLEIIDSGMKPDDKDTEMRRKYPQDYALLLKEVYPLLRHSDYVVQYQIKQYTSVEDIRRAFRERPSNLNESEMFTLIEACDPAGPEYNSVMETAIRLFPDNPRLQFLYGIALMQKKDYAAARGYFEKSAAAGIKEASEALPYVDRILNPVPAVRYIN